MYLLRLSGPGYCFGLGGGCLSETRQNPTRTYSSKCMEWNELRKACTMPDRCLEQDGPLLSGIQPYLILWEGRSPELIPGKVLNKWINYPVAQLYFWFPSDPSPQARSGKGNKIACGMQSF